MTVRESVIERAMAFAMDKVLDRYAEDVELPIEVAREHERELKRYLALCALNPGRAYAMAGPVDELWHTFVAFTQPYARFCDQVAGRFIHHVPRDGDEEAEEASGQYRQFLEAYEATFGQPAPAHIWPRPEP